MLRAALRIAAATCLAAPLAAVAQSYPVKPIRMIVPLAPGGGVDAIARLLAGKMAASLGQPVVVENRAGANGSIGSEIAARAAPDGYTILFTTPSSHVTNVLLSKSVRYDPIKDFTPITAVAEPATCLVVHPSIAVGSVKELVDYAKVHPGRLAYGSAGVGSVFHLTGEMFALAAGVALLHVPYKGSGAALADLMSGQIPLTFTSAATVLPHVHAGKLKLLAVLERARYPGLPDVPTVGETLAGFEKPASWYGVFGPAGLPPGVQARLQGEIAKALGDAEVRARFAEGALTPIGNTPEQFAALLRNGMEIYGKAIAAAGIHPE